MEKMETKKLDENTQVFIYVYLKSGEHIVERTIAKSARESILAWKYFIQYWYGPEEQRKNVPAEKMPFPIYHFLDGRPQTEDEPLPIKTMFLMQDIIAMTYYPVPEDSKECNHASNMADSFKEYVDLLKKELNKGEDWRKEE